MLQTYPFRSFGVRPLPLPRYTVLSLHTPTKGVLSMLPIGNETKLTGTRRSYFPANPEISWQNSDGRHLLLQQPRPIVERLGDMRVLRTQHLLSYGLRTLVQRLCFRVLALHISNRSVGTPTGIENNWPTHVGRAKYPGKL